MIPLRHRATAPAAIAPFVVRLSAANTFVTADDARFRQMTETGALFESVHGPLSVDEFDPDEGLGDVLLVLPALQVAHRLIRANSPHNTLLVTERCDQVCVMCSQPPKRHHIDMFEHLTKAALLAPEHATLGVSGGEPLLYKLQLFSMIETVLRQRPDLSFHVLSNAQHFEPDDGRFLSGLPEGKVLWGIPLYSPIGGHHDELVGKPGAFDGLLRSFAILAKAGATIELRTVVMKTNVAALPLLASMITRKLPFISNWAIMQLENIGYGRMNWDKLFLDTSTDFSLVARALNIARGRGISSNLYNFPLCTVPADYRALASPTISDWKKKYLPDCADCSVRASCGGFFEWYLHDRGFQRIGL